MYCTGSLPLSEWPPFSYPPSHFQGFFIDADSVRRLQKFLTTSPDGLSRPELPVWMLALLRQDTEDFESCIELENCSISRDVQALLFPVDGEAASGSRPVVTSLVLQLGKGCRWAGTRTSEAMPDSLVFTSYL